MSPSSKFCFQGQWALLFPSTVKHCSGSRASDPSGCGRPSDSATTRVTVTKRTVMDASTCEKVACRRIVPQCVEFLNISGRETGHYSILEPFSDTNTSPRDVRHCHFTPDAVPRGGGRSARFTVQIADPVAVAVFERSHVDLVDDLGLPPVRFERIAHAVDDELGTGGSRPGAGGPQPQARHQCVADHGAGHGGGGGMGEGDTNRYGIPTTRARARTHTLVCTLVRCTRWVLVAVRTRVVYAIGRLPVGIYTSFGRRLSGGRRYLVQDYAHFRDRWRDVVASSSVP